MSLRAIDANIVLRFVTADHPEMSPRCRALFQRVQDGGEEVYLAEAALCDVVWTLRSFYRWPAEKICSLVGDLLAMEGVRMQRKILMWSALSTFRQEQIDFSDALIAAEMSMAQIDEIYSYDRDFDQIAEISRFEP